MVGTKLSPPTRLRSVTSIMSGLFDPEEVTSALPSSLLETPAILVTASLIPASLLGDDWYYSVYFIAYGLTLEAFIFPDNIILQCSYFFLLIVKKFVFFPVLVSSDIIFCSRLSIKSQMNQNEIILKALNSIRTFDNANIFTLQTMQHFPGDFHLFFCPLIAGTKKESDESNNHLTKA